MRITLFLGVILLAAMACGGQKSEYKAILTQKKWKYDEAAIREAIKDKPLSTMEMNLVDATMSRMKGATMEFQKDGTFVLTDASGEKRIGKWNLSADGKELFMALSNIMPDPNVIEVFTPEKIVLAPMRDRGMVFPKIMVPAE